MISENNEIQDPSLKYFQLKVFLLKISKKYLRTFTVTAISIEHCPVLKNLSHNLFNIKLLFYTSLKFERKLKKTSIS